MSDAQRAVVLRRLGRRPYREVSAAMRAFTDERGAQTLDELWLVEHPPVFTLGVNAGREHLLAPGDIEIVETDRGGQVTYHGPGQVVLYPLLDLRRYGLGPRSLVSLLERSTIALLAEYGIEAAARDDAPGVYVEGRKIASIGLRIRRGASYHGLALNVAMDLTPFARINPCGYAGLTVTSLQQEGGPDAPGGVRERLARRVLQALGEAGRMPARFVPADDRAPWEEAVQPGARPER